MPTCALVLALTSAGARADLITSSPNLPPLGGEYVTPAQAHQLYNAGALTIEVIDVQHRGFSQSFPPPQNVGDMTAHSFGSTVLGDVIVNGGTPMPFSASAQVTVDVTKASGPNGSPLGTYSTQMTQLDITGLPGGVEIRIDPTTPSVGQTTISNAGGGQFRIDSFFDIFTDISLDSGQTWIPATGPARVNLTTPEPAGLTLALLGGLGVVAYGWRGRRPVA